MESNENPTLTTNAGLSSRASNYYFERTSTAQFNSDAQLLTEFEEFASGESFVYANSIPRSPPAINQMRSVVISGRNCDKVYDLVGLSELCYADSHGMDIIFPAKDMKTIYVVSKSTDQTGKEVNLFQPASEFLPMINEIFRKFVEITKDIKGSKVENHKFCVSVHYRNVEENGQAERHIFCTNSESFHVFFLV